MVDISILVTIASLSTLLRVAIVVIFVFVAKSKSKRRRKKIESKMIAAAKKEKVNRENLTHVSLGTYVYSGNGEMLGFSPFSPNTLNGQVSFTVVLDVLGDTAFADGK